MDTGRGAAIGRKQDHAPIPWSAYSCANVQDANGRIVASTKNSMDTDFIVKSVNSHDALVEALKDMREKWHHMIGLSSPKEWHELNARAEKALMLAGEEV